MYFANTMPIWIYIPMTRMWRISRWFILSDDFNDEIPEVLAKLKGKLTTPLMMHVLLTFFGSCAGAKERLTKQNFEWVKIVHLNSQSPEGYLQHGDLK